MNSLHISNYERVASEYAEEIHINDEKKKYFLDGVKWAFKAIKDTISNTGHPMADDSMNAKMSEWTLKDIKKAMKQLEDSK